MAHFFYNLCEKMVQIAWTTREIGLLLSVYVLKSENLT